ncbi:MAG: hypothetical protein ABI549_13045 [Flavobacterium sp.]|uniref:hypothetical protein n=1 Tax=Flavobacterium sp. TaxID=239 RepID=UPI003264DB2C
MKLSNFFYITLLLFSLSAKSQREKDVIESLNIKLATFSVSIAGQDTFYQIKTEEFGKKIVLELFYGNELLSKTVFYRNQFDRIETSIAPAGNLILSIFTKNGKMSYISIQENKEILVTEQNIPLKTSEAEAQSIKESFENLLK